MVQVAQSRVMMVHLRAEDQLTGFPGCTAQSRRGCHSPSIAGLLVEWPVKVWVLRATGPSLSSEVISTLMISFTSCFEISVEEDIAREVGVSAIAKPLAT